MRTRMVFVATGLMLLCTSAMAQVGGVIVELNKLEQMDNACRAYLVTRNLTDRHFESLMLNVVMFNNDGIVAKLLAVDLAPLPPGKTRVTIFDIKNLPCGNIGQLLLNDVMQCKTAKGKRDDCLALIRVQSRTKVPFIN